VEDVSTQLLDWAVATRPFPGEARSADGHLVHVAPWGALLAVADGVGHGSEAAAATRIALAALEQHAHEPLGLLLERCHDSLRGTRGVALSMSAFHGDADTMTWLGVGNVAGVLLRAAPQGTPPAETLVMRAGLVGDRMPAVSASTTRVARGDTLILATDGIRTSFAESPSLADAPQELAELILARYGKGTDDALVLVARYLGGSG